MPRVGCRASVLAVLMAARLACAATGAEGARTFDVPAGDAVDTLKQAARQGGVDIVFLAETVRGVRTSAVRGQFTPSAALEQLVRNTGLVIVRDPGTGTITVNRARAEEPSRPVDGAPKTTQTMKRTKPLAALASVLGLLLPQTGDAQTSNPPGGTGAEKTVTLTPFEVTSNRDVGYTATSSLAGGRLATDLKDTPVALSVLTREFLDDIAASTFLDAAEWAPNTSSVYSYSAQNQFNDYQTATRSLGASFQARNYFIWYLNSDAYNTERLDFARGPNSVVFGDANVGGTANISTKRAYRGSLTEVQYRNSDWGGKGRATLDVNRAINAQWFLRLNALYDHSKGWEDRVKTDRDGWFGTTTYQPFKNTSIRAEYEWGRIKRVVPNVATDSISGWNGVNTVTEPLTTGAFSGGITRRSTDFLTFTPGAPEFGVVNWRNYGATTGNGRALDTFVPSFTPANFPTIPYYGYNFTAPNNYADNKYHAYAAFVEQKVGENLFFEAAYNRQWQYRYVDQLVWEGVAVDVNAIVPQPTAAEPNRTVRNPYFLQRYAEAGNTQVQMQGNKVEDFRVSAAYLLKTPLTDQRLLASVGRRVDYFELKTDRLGRVNNPAVTDMFNAANALRLRRYESELDKEWRPAVGNYNGAEIRFGTQASQDQEQSIDYLQAAASGGWFKNRRLKTLVGVRRDTLDRLGNNGVLTRGPNNEITGRGPLVRTLKKRVTTMTVGSVYQVTDAIGVFANYGESFQPAGLAIDINSNSIPPPENKGVDVGVRLSLLNNRISGSISYYANEQENVRLGGPATQINAIWQALNRGETVPAGYNDRYTLKGKGVEVDFTANLTPNWRMLFNIAFPETEQVSGYEATTAYYNANIQTWERLRDALPAAETALRNTVNTNISAVQTTLSNFAPGRELNNTFDYTANLFTNYSFREGPLKNFQVGGGINFRGKRLVTNRPTSSFDYLYANPYQLVTLTAGYRTKLFGKETRLQLNISNLFDEEFKRYSTYANYTVNGVTSFERNRYILQPPRRIALTTTVRF